MFVLCACAGGDESGVSASPVGADVGDVVVVSAAPTLTRSQSAELLGEEVGRVRAIGLAKIKPQASAA